MSDGILDFHVHAFPPEMGDAAKGAAEIEGERFWNALMVGGTQGAARAPAASGTAVPGQSLQGWVTLEQMLRQMDEAGIEKVVLQGWYWQNAQTASAHNAWMADCVRRHPDRIAAFASWVPTPGKQGTWMLHWFEDQGFSGLGELHPAVQDFALDGEAWQEAAEFATKRQWPVLLHVTEPVGRPYTPCEQTDFRALQQFIESHPSLQIVLAHWGGLVFTHLLNPYIAKHWKQVWFDCAASALLYEPRVMNLALQILPAERIVFGSDYPLRVYPSDARQPEFTRFLASMREEVELEQDWQWISRGNARRLLGLDCNHGR